MKQIVITTTDGKKLYTKEDAAKLLDLKSESLSRYIANDILVPEKTDKLKNICLFTWESIKHAALIARRADRVLMQMESI